MKATLAYGSGSNTAVEMPWSGLAGPVNGSESLSDLVATLRSSVNLNLQRKLAGRFAKMSADAAKITAILARNTADPLPKAQEILCILRQGLDEDLTKEGKDYRVATKLHWPLPAGARRIRAIRNEEASDNMAREFIAAVEQHAAPSAVSVPLSLRRQRNAVAMLARIDDLEAELDQIREELAGG